MVMHEIWRLHVEIKDVVMEIMNLKTPELESKAELRQSSVHAAAATVPENFVLKKRSIVQGGACGKSITMYQSAVEP